MWGSCHGGQIDADMHMMLHSFADLDFAFLGCDLFWLLSSLGVPPANFALISWRMLMSVIFSVSKREKFKILIIFRSRYL